MSAHPPSTVGVWTIAIATAIHFAAQLCTAQVEIHHSRIKVEVHHGITRPTAALGAPRREHGPLAGVGVTVLPRHDHGGGLDQLEAEAELVGLEVSQARDGALEEVVGGECPEDVEGGDAVDRPGGGVGVVVEEHGHHVGAHHLGGEVEGSFSGGAGRSIDVRRAELEQGLHHFPTAVLHCIVQGQSLIKVQTCQANIYAYMLNNTRSYNLKIIFPIKIIILDIFI